MLLVKKKKGRSKFRCFKLLSERDTWHLCSYFIGQSKSHIKLNISWVERNIPTMERNRECFNKKCNLFCSLWAHCLCTSLWLWMSIQGCCKESIQTVFKAVPDLHFVFLIVVSYMSLSSTLITIFRQVGYVLSLTYDEDFATHVCHSHSHYPQLHICRARGQVLSIWSGIIDSRTLDYQRTNPRECQLVRTDTNKTTWIKS